MLTPTAVAERAHANGVQVWALTDHDELSGLADARRTAEALGMTFIPGVEVSVTWAGHTIHVLGLGVDELSMSPASIPTVKEIVRGWSASQAQRLARQALGLDSADSVRALVKNSASLHKAH